MKHVTIETYTHKGIGITVQIDYDNGTVSLVEKKGNEFIDKKYIFVGRELKYMNRWLDILEAVENAITQAKVLLEEHQEEKDKVKLEILYGNDSTL